MAMEEAGLAVRLRLSAPPAPFGPPDLTHQGGPGRTDSVIPTSLPLPPQPHPGSSPWLQEHLMTAH